MASAQYTTKKVNVQGAPINSPKKTIEVMETVVTDRESYFAQSLFKHSFIGFLSFGASRLLWKIPFFNAKTQIQVNDLVLPDEIKIKEKRSTTTLPASNLVITEVTTEVSDEPLNVNVTWNGMETEAHYQIAQFLANRTIWNSRQLGMLKAFTNTEDHNLLTTGLQSALTTALTYPLYKRRVQESVGLPKQVYNWFDFGYLTSDSFQSTFVYNILVHLGTFMLEAPVRNWVFGPQKGIIRPQDAREQSVWSYYLSLTLMKILLNPLEIICKENIVIDSPGGAISRKPIKEESKGTLQGICGYVTKLLKGALITVPETFVTGLGEFYLYRYMNRNIGPHSRDE